MSKNEVALTVLVAVAVGMGFKAYFKSSTPSTEPNSQAVLSQLANDTNRSLPMMIDKDTELVATVDLPGTFVYNYRMVNHVAEDIDPQKANRAPEAQSHQWCLHDSGNPGSVSAKGRHAALHVHRQRSTSYHLDRRDAAGLQGLNSSIR